MIEVGRLCIKTAGRDAGKKCVVVDAIDEHTVLVDGETRRRKCNIMHLLPLRQTIEVKKGASHEEVAEALKKWKIETRMTKPKVKAEKKEGKKTMKKETTAKKSPVAAEKKEEKKE